MKGLTVHRADTESDALNHLFIGDTNRVVSETPKNDASTRSHCIFIIQIEAQKYGEDVKTVSKLHLVDLSGSESNSHTNLGASKDGLVGERLNEAKYINLSLHYLAQVIEALNKRLSGEMVHVPYRNSMMTMVLRDSLGGNCKTKMIATINPTVSDVYESLSTCRFAERVAKIRNDAQKNEVTDPAIIIQRLKKENAELKAEIALLKGGKQKEHLEPEDIDECNKLVEEFISNKDPSATILLADKLKINQCFYHFKHIYLDLKKRGGNGPVEPPSKKNTDELTSEIQRLQMLVKQRDNEILILVNLLNKKKANGEGGEGAYVKLSRPEEEAKEERKYEYKPVVFPSQKSETPGVEPAGNIVAESIHSKRSINNVRAEEQKHPEFKNMTAAYENIRPEDLMDRAKAFEMFRKSYRRNEATEENKSLLKEKFGVGKRLGQEVNQTRERIRQLTNRLENLRKDNALRGMVDRNGEIIRTPEEDQLQSEVAAAKSLYQQQYSALKELKGEIEGIQALLERSKDRMNKDFEQWFEMMLRQYQGVHAGPRSTYSNVSDASRVKDPKVNESLSAFYKARDEIYQKVSKDEA
eukprot:TRINITY_DN9282_c0_g1_i10.p1 TRINITY_DN9282_c0_g1~~TRINITY_DN9282_c0_g1_i10.p1  ORF type:complete len:584 (+),score=206.55 TRINITY_DN9282_c0_g1_i10:821-2572(+)